MQSLRLNELVAPKILLFLYNEENRMTKECDAQIPELSGEGHQLRHEPQQCNLPESQIRNYINLGLQT